MGQRTGWLGDKCREAVCLATAGTVWVDSGTEWDLQTFFWDLNRTELLGRFC